MIVDSVHVVRAGLEALIDAQPDLETLAHASSGEEALQALRRLRRRRPRPGIVALVGLGLAGERDAYWLIEAIRDRWPHIAVVACGLGTDRHSISRALFQGADGFLDLTARPSAFLQGLRSAARGEFVLEGVPEDWLGQIADGVERESENASALTSREREVLQVAAQGLTARQIAHRLGVRERTVTTHLGHIYSKLGATGRIEAITRAADAGLVSLGSSR